MDLGNIDNKNTMQSIINLNPGYFIIINDSLYAGTADGIISLDTIQFEGKRIMSIKEFILGYKGFKGNFD